MAAHARSIVTGTSVSIPVGGGRMLLGTWQGVYLWEHRTHPHTRTVVVTVSG
jgi:secondary thiamine-phosphate synthase enzyme